MSNGTTWSTDFEPPPPPRTDRIYLERLGPAVAELDFAALMGSRARLRAELQWGDWPRDDFTLAENRKDLERHDAEYENREAYAYSVLDDPGSRCLGCIYLEPWEHGARLAFWVVDAELDNSLEAHLLSAVLEWVCASWSFDRVLVPLRATNERGIAAAETLGLTRIASGGLDDHVNYVWVRPAASPGAPS